MSEKTRSPLPTPLSDEEIPRPGESFFSRFHRRKALARQSGSLSTIETELPEAESQTIAVQTDTGIDTGTEADSPIELTDADMPPLETLGADSDYTGFLSPKVSETLRRAALRKLFHGAEFNLVDGLDDYAEDFTRFEALGDLVTADMRHQLEVEAKKQAEALKQALLDEDDEIEFEDDIALDRPGLNAPGADIQVEQSAGDPSDTPPTQPPADP